MLAEAEQAVAYRGKIGRHDPAGEEVHICRFDDRPEVESEVNRGALLPPAVIRFWKLSYMT